MKSLFRSHLDRLSFPLTIKPGEIHSCVLHIEPRPQNNESDITAISISGHLSSLLTVGWQAEGMFNPVTFQHIIKWTRPAETDFLISVTFDSPLSLFSIFKVEVSVTNLSDYPRNLDILLPQSYLNEGEFSGVENQSTLQEIIRLGGQVPNTEDLQPLICLEASLPLGVIIPKATTNVKLHCVALKGKYF